MIESAIIGHLMGDFLFQNDFIAHTKKKDSLVCAIHCLIWTAMVSITGQILHPAALTWLFVTHYFIDRWQFIPWVMAFRGQKSFRDNLSPWSTIITDNVYHLVTIWIVFALPQSPFAWIMAVGIVLNFFLYAMDVIEGGVTDQSPNASLQTKQEETSSDRDS